MRAKPLQAIGQLLDTGSSVVYAASPRRARPARRYMGPSSGWPIDMGS
jgi:hypothetical protein